MAKHRENAADISKLREAAEAPILATAADIVAGLRRHGVPPEVGLAIIGVVAGELIDQLPKQRRVNWARQLYECLIDGL